MYNIIKEYYYYSRIVLFSFFVVFFNVWTTLLWLDDFSFLFVCVTFYTQTFAITKFIRFSLLILLSCRKENDSYWWLKMNLSQSIKIIYNMMKENVRKRAEGVNYSLAVGIATYWLSWFLRALYEKYIHTVQECRRVVLRRSHINIKHHERTQ